MPEKIIPGTHYKFLFALLAMVYLAGMFVPLMDNDAAHHANIALHMYLTGDYVNLIDNGQDYLDKPHLHFWLAAFSFKIFGVNGFVYRFPSLLFTILGTFSTYRLGKLLYDNETGKLAALVAASAFAYILSNTDVRMDAVLTACIIFSCWQLIAFINHQKLSELFLAAFGLAAGFSTKGYIAVLIPAVSVLCYLLQQKQLKKIFDGRWLLLVVLFFIFISPVLFCFYQQFDLHPEKIIKGHQHISGLRFILWNQSVERLSGDRFGADGGNDYFFFFHTFLWAFLPWSIICFTAIFTSLKKIRLQQTPWVLVGPILVMMLLITFSGFKLPHYLNVIFPLAAILTAAFLKKIQTKWAEKILIVQKILIVIILVAVAAINVWAFPVHSFLVSIITILLLAIVFYYWRNNQLCIVSKTIFLSTAGIILLFFLLNTNFYTQLLKYQAGNELAFAHRNEIDRKNIFFMKDEYSSSFSFYTKTLRKELNDSIKINQTVWLIAGKNDLPALKNRFIIMKNYSHLDYEITRLNLKFINPAKREQECSRMYLLQVQSKL